MTHPLVVGGEILALSFSGVAVALPPSVSGITAAGDAQATGAHTVLQSSTWACTLQFVSPKSQRRDPSQVQPEERVALGR